MDNWKRDALGMNLDHAGVESSAIKSYAYHPESRTLQVRFKSGKLYSHRDVPADLVTKVFESGESVGRNYNTLIAGKFEHVVHE